MALSRSGRLSVIFAMPGRTGSTTTALLTIDPSSSTRLFARSRARQGLDALRESRRSKASAPFGEAGARLHPLPVVDRTDFGVEPERREVLEQLRDTLACGERRS